MKRAVFILVSLVPGVAPALRAEMIDDSQWRTLDGRPMII
jgi:hypothetical protein